MCQAGLFPSWRDGLKRQGVRLPAGEQGLQIYSSAAVVPAALNGKGVALARRALAGEDVRTGRLLGLMPQVCWPISWAYCVAHPDAQALRWPTQDFVDWPFEEV